MHSSHFTNEWKDLEAYKFYFSARLSGEDVDDEELEKLEEIISYEDKVIAIIFLNIKIKVSPNQNFLD